MTRLPNKKPWLDYRRRGLTSRYNKVSADYIDDELEYLRKKALVWMPEAHKQTLKDTEEVRCKKK